MSGGVRGGKILRSVYTGVLDCLFPKHCLLCKQEGEYACPSCVQGLHLSYPLHCFGCEKSSISGELCAVCQLRYAFGGVIIAGNYEDTPLGTLITTCKYRFVKEIADSLGWLVCQKLEKVITNPNVDISLAEHFFQAVVTAVPLSKRRWRQREFNQADLMARVVAQYFNLRYEPDWLGRRSRKPQSSLDEKQRQRNLVDSFFVQKQLEDIPQLVLVIDDVITTGATLQESARVLQGIGVEQVWGVMVAKG